MFDGTPILFRERPYFRHIGHHTIAITTINAVLAFNYIEVAQAIAINNNHVVTTPDPGNAIESKTNVLVNSHKHIKQDKGYP